MSWSTIEGWPGRVWTDGRGIKTFYIRERRGAKRYSISTRCTSLKAALAEHSRFEMDPDGYRPKGVEEHVVLDDKLIERYVAWCRAEAAKEARVLDERWLQAKGRYLRWWASQLKRRPLKLVPLRDISRALEGATSQKDRIACIKHLYAYLRATDQILASEDPTLDKLSVPQSVPAQDARGSKVIPEQDFRDVLPFLAPEVADSCRVMAATGCHLSEVMRLVQTGTVEAGSQHGVEGDVLGFLHKGRHYHRVQVSSETGDAVRRLKASTWQPARETFYRAIRQACAQASHATGRLIPTWTPGRFRHTFATRNIAAGAAPEAVALALGHKGAVTTLTWYATTAVAPMVSAGGYK